MAQEEKRKSRSFKDAEGRLWVVSVNVSSIRLVRAQVGVDLYELAGAATGLMELYDDPVKLVEVIWHLCSKAASKENVSEDEFCEAMLGDAIAGATDAFEGALVDFFPDGKRRAILQEMMAKRREFMAAILTEEMNRVKEMDVQEAAQKITASARPSGSSADSPESSESTPDPSPSGTSP